MEKQNTHRLYVLKDPDGYFLMIKGTRICKRITRYEFLDYRRFLPEYGWKKVNK